MTAPQDPVRFGKITGHYGVRGWVKVFAYTRPLESLLDYRAWWVMTTGGWLALDVAECRLHGKGIIARIAGVSDRNAAEPLLGNAFFVQRGDMPAADEDSYYWAELVGLDVVNQAGEHLGKVDHLFETGANDVIVVRGERERLIPWLRPDVVLEVDLDGGRMRVDWDADF
ncbi:MAG: ribosome maturation factor RimM [Pseudomonadota bacterium]